jgi:hypothetical protein
MKKIMKQAGPIVIGAAAAAAGGAVSGYSNTAKEKLDFLKNLPGWAWPAIKIGVGALIPIAAKNFAKGKSGKQVVEVAEKFSAGFMGVAGMELANETISTDTPLELSNTISGPVPTLGYPGNRVSGPINTLGTTDPFPY